MTSATAAPAAIPVIPNEAWAEVASLWAGGLEDEDSSSLSLPSLAVSRRDGSGDAPKRRTSEDGGEPDSPARSPPENEGVENVGVVEPEPAVPLPQHSPSSGQVPLV